MSKTLPTVNSSEFPMLAALISKYASRYELRRDGSELWEGWVSDSLRLTPPEIWEEMVTKCPEMGPWLEQHRALPVLALPTSYELIAHPNEFVSYYASPGERAIVAKDAGEVFIIHHTGEDRYWLETAWIRRGRHSAILSPREVFLPKELRGFDRLRPRLFPPATRVCAL